MGTRIPGAVLVAYLLSAYAAVIVLVGDLNWQWVWLVFGKYAATAVPAWILCAILFLCVVSWNELKSPQPRRPHRLAVDLLGSGWSRRRVLILIGPPLLYVTLFGLFALFKQHVLIHAEFRLDRAFMEMDRAIFGTDPWRLTHGSPALTEFLGASYYGWYAPAMLGTLAFAFITKRTQLRDRYITAFVLTWIVVGSFMAYLLPAAGPCYWSVFVEGSDHYSELMASLRHDVAVSTSYNPVLDAQTYLLKAYGGHSVLGGGISAMPSMHVAAATLFACGAWQINRVLGLAFALFAGVVWWASVHLGWHYFVDGLVAIPATLAVWWFCGVLYPESIRRPIPRPLTAVPAE